MLVKQSSSFSRKHRTISPDLCPPSSPVDYKICRLMQERVYIVQSPVHYTSHLKQRLINTWASISQNVINEADSQWRKRGKRTSLWTSASLKPALFRAHTLHNRLFSESSTVYRVKHTVSRYFHRSHLKVSKSEGTKKVKYAYHFWNCADAVDRKLSLSQTGWRFG